MNRIRRVQKCIRRRVFVLRLYFCIFAFVLICCVHKKELIFLRRASLRRASARARTTQINYNICVLFLFSIICDLKVNQQKKKMNQQHESIEWRDKYTMNEKCRQQNESHNFVNIIIYFFVVLSMLENLFEIFFFDFFFGFVFSFSFLSKFDF